MPPFQVESRKLGRTIRYQDEYCTKLLKYHTVSAKNKWHDKEPVFEYSINVSARARPILKRIFWKLAAAVSYLAKIKCKVAGSCLLLWRWSWLSKPCAVDHKSGLYLLFYSLWNQKGLTIIYKGKDLNFSKHVVHLAGGAPLKGVNIGWVMVVLISRFDFFLLFIVGSKYLNLFQKFAQNRCWHP